MRRVVIFAFEGLQVLDAVGPQQVFASANDMKPGAYDIRVVSPKGGIVTSSGGLGLVTEPLDALEGLPIHTLILAGGEEGVAKVLETPAAMAWIGKVVKRATRACTVCSGTFLLAATGLADGRTVATHWRAARLLQKLHPKLKVDPEAIYVEDGKFWTSAGVTTGIDLALALVERDHDRETAMRIARRLVVYMRRPGHQSQFSNTLKGQSVTDSRLSALVGWMRENLGAELGVETLAERAGMCARSFTGPSRPNSATPQPASSRRSAWTRRANTSPIRRCLWTRWRISRASAAAEG